jgi:hypothetical protein
MNPKPLIMTSCDSQYLIHHAPALVLSSVLSGNDFHLHVVFSKDNRDDELLVALWMRNLKRRILEVVEPLQPRISLSTGPITHPLKGGENRVYWACDRFTTAYSMLTWGEMFDCEFGLVSSLIIVDTDCLVLQKFPEPAESVGLFFRNSLPGTTGWEAAGTRVAAGLVYAKNDAVGAGFLHAVSERIKQGPVQWFLDQVAIAEAAAKTTAAIYPFGPDILDWEFKPGTVIWTGKGDRKYSNATYLAKKAYYTEMIGHV